MNEALGLGIESIENMLAFLRKTYIHIIIYLMFKLSVDDNHNINVSRNYT